MQSPTLLNSHTQAKLPNSDIRAIRLQLEEMKQVGPEWDGPSTITPEPDVVDRAAAWLTEHWRTELGTPDICPSADGGISSLWANNPGDPLTEFYILSQDSAGSATIPFDEANMVARCIGLELAEDPARQIYEKKGSNINLLTAKRRFEQGRISPNAPTTRNIEWNSSALEAPRSPSGPRTPRLMPRSQTARRNTATGALAPSYRTSSSAEAGPGTKPCHPDLGLAEPIPEFSKRAESVLRPAKARIPGH